MEVESRLERSAEEPRQPGQRHERPDMALSPPLPRRHATHEEHRADREVRDREGAVVRPEGRPFGRDSEGDPAKENRQPKRTHPFTRALPPAPPPTARSW